MFTDFLSVFLIHHGLNMCLSFSTFFIVGRHIFRSKSPVYICFESRCLNISNALKRNTVQAEYYLAGNDREGCSTVPDLKVPVFMLPEFNPEDRRTSKLNVSSNLTENRLIIFKKAGHVQCNI